MEAVRKYLFSFFLVFQTPDSPQISRHTKKQGNMTHSKQQNKSAETHPKETQASDLLDKDFETSLKYAQRTKGNQENKILTYFDRLIHEQNENVNKETEIIFSFRSSMSGA